MTLRPGCLIGDKNAQYRIRQHLGAGSFGNVYEAENVTSCKTVAVKVQDITSEHDMYCSLDYESYVLQQLSGIEGIPTLIHFGFDIQNGLKLIVTDLLKVDIHQVLRDLRGRLSRRTTLKLADKLLTILEEINSRGFIHRDIKPSNIMLGGDESMEKIFIIDYGLAKPYIDLVTREHIPFYDGISGLGGNWWTSSVYAHRGLEQGRLIALGYNFVIFLTGNLPWFGFRNEPVPQKYEKVGLMKGEFTFDLLCEGLPKEFSTYFEYCHGLQFHQEPDYHYLRGIFKNLFLNLSKDETFKYDWKSVNEMERVFVGESDEVSENQCAHSPAQSEHSHTESGHAIGKEDVVSFELSAKITDDSTKGAKPIATDSESSKSDERNSNGRTPFTSKQKSGEPLNACDGRRIEGPLEIPGTSHFLFIQYDGDQVLEIFQAVKVPFHKNGGSTHNQGSNEAKSSAQPNRLWVRGPLNLPNTNIYILIQHWGNQPIGFYEARKVHFQKCEAGQDHEGFGSDASISDPLRPHADGEYQGNSSALEKQSDFDDGSHYSKLGDSDSTTKSWVSSSITNAPDMPPLQNPGSTGSTTVSVSLDEGDSNRDDSSVGGSDSPLNIGFCESLVAEESESNNEESCCE